LVSNAFAVKEQAGQYKDNAESAYDKIEKILEDAVNGDIDDDDDGDGDGNDDGDGDGDDDGDGDINDETLDGWV